VNAGEGACTAKQPLQGHLQQSHVSFKTPLTCTVLQSIPACRFSMLKALASHMVQRLQIVRHYALARNACYAACKLLIAYLWWG
jgi:hypothetical protein